MQGYVGKPLSETIERSETYMNYCQGQCNCPPPPPPPGPNPRQTCILAMQVLDSFSVRGQGQRAPLNMCNLCPGNMVKLLQGTIFGPVVLDNPSLESSRGRYGCCLSACLTIPYQVEVMANGCCEVLRTVLKIPVSGVFRNRCEAAMEYIAQVQIFPTGLQWCGNQLEICFNYNASVYATCLRPVNVDTCSPKCEPSCEPFFNMPLYPSFQSPCGM